MRVNKVQPTFVDIDGTLILHVGIGDLSDLNVSDPLEPSRTIRLKKHYAMIRILVEEHRRGACIKVWSRGGWEWAEAVIKALGLEQYVDEVMDKPMAYLDDVPVEDWLTNRVYIKPGTPYKGS